MLSERENTLRTIRFEEPEWIPCRIGLSSGIWNRHREALEDVVIEHPTIFGPYERGQRDFDEFPDAHRAGEEWRDPWGSVWHNVSSGICGQPKVHPLESWDGFSNYKAPEPFGNADLEKLREEAEGKRSEGKMIWGGAGRFYERLMFLRGFRNLDGFHKQSSRVGTADRCDHWTQPCRNQGVVGDRR